MYYSVLIICPEITGGGEEYRSQQLAAYLSRLEIDVALLTKSGLFFVENEKLNKQSLFKLPSIAYKRVVFGFKRWSIVPSFILGIIAKKCYYSVANEYHGKKWMDIFLRKMLVISISKKVYRSNIEIELGNNKYSEITVDWDRRAPVKVLWIGKDNFHKGYNRFKCIVETLKTVEFVVCGLFSHEEESWLLRQDNVRYLGWVEGIDDIASESLVYLQTSNQEGFPNVLVECRQLGLPIVATDVGATSDILLATDKLLPRDVNEIDLVNEISLAMEQYETMRENSMSMIEEAKKRFDENRMKEKYLELCRR